MFFFNFSLLDEDGADPFGSPVYLAKKLAKDIARATAIGSRCFLRREVSFLFDVPPYASSFFYHIMVNKDEY